MRGACEKKPPCPLNMPFQELNRTSPRVFTTGSSRSAARTMESRFCTLKNKKINIKQKFFFNTKPLNVSGYDKKKRWIQSIFQVGFSSLLKWCFS